MKIADNDQHNLTAEEQVRNKRSGDICLFYAKGQQSALRRAGLNKGVEYCAEFESLDEVAGTVYGLDQPDLPVVMSGFKHPNYAKHST